MMRKKLNPRFVSPTREYSFKEIAHLYKLNIRTVQKWPRYGLKVLEGTLSPILVLGSDLLEFFKVRDEKCKKPISKGEFYCTRCNESRSSLQKEVKFLPTNKRTGSGKKQFRITGICEVCSCPLNRIANEDQLEDFKNGLKKKRC
jgi:hypothetical protein